MRSLSAKLTIAFLLIGLTGAFLVAIISQQRTRAAFSQFIVNREQQAIAQVLVTYYQAYGGWDGLQTNLPKIYKTQPGGQPGDPELRKEMLDFTLVGPEKTIIYALKENQIGKTVSNRNLNKALALVYNGTIIGWILPLPENRQWNPNTPEGLFLRNVNSSALLSAGIASLLALFLGSLLAFTMTRSLRELTDATVDIARGKLVQVKVRSQDELGELANSFNQMSRDLDRATRARRQMTADVAHDLRTPLSVIGGYAEALTDGKLEGTPEIYDIVYHETLHLSRLVDDLRILSLADAGELPLAMQPVHPKDMLERVAARHAVAASQQGVALKVDAPDGLPAVNVDVERMAQVLDNLVINAFRYTPLGGEVRLEAQALDGQVRLVVHDTGSGISADDLPHVFDRFYRGDKARQSGGESGLGLAIAKSIIEAHGGTIRVESTPGNGAAFTIELPAA